jgi:hypothetical protein
MRAPRGDRRIAREARQIGVIGSEIAHILIAEIDNQRSRDSTFTGAGFDVDPRASTVKLGSISLSSRRDDPRTGDESPVPGPDRCGTEVSRINFSRPPERLSQTRSSFLVRFLRASAAEARTILSSDDDYRRIATLPPKKAQVRTHVDYQGVGRSAGNGCSRAL